MSDDIQRRAVRSSNVKSIGYDRFKRLLEVEFHNGGVYHFHEVSPEDHRRLMTADSVGAHLHMHIKGRFDSSKHRSKGVQHDESD